MAWMRVVTDRLNDAITAGIQGHRLRVPWLFVERPNRTANLGGRFHRCSIQDGHACIERRPTLSGLNVRIRRLHALQALHDLERRILIFLQRLETAALNFREVCEEVFAAVVRCDEVKTPGVVEQLHRTHCSISAPGCQRIRKAPREPCLKRTTRPTRRKLDHRDNRPNLSNLVV